MLKRTITAIVLVAVFIPICIFSDTFIWPAAMAILSFVAADEMLGCVGMKKSLSAAIPSYLLAAFLPLLPYFVKESTIELLFALCILYLIWIFAAVVFSRGKIDFMHAASAFMGIFYVAVSFSCLVLLRTVGNYFYLLVFIGPWTSDTFAYLCGRLFGKHKLIPEVSPKKTVEGSIGGIVFAAVAYVLYAVIIHRFFDAFSDPNLFIMAAAGAIVSVISQIGDLSASVIKRRFDVKDYGKIFPGHGGVLDRFDSVLLTAPVLYILTQIPVIGGLLL
ncbi:MAG: phosphatidate cytidylyltransferase [Clostridia bacterium]|nr:phosphatidate cytidylyltransferase [Clostridia bacterium]